MAPDPASGTEAVWPEVFGQTAGAAVIVAFGDGLTVTVTEGLFVEAQPPASTTVNV